MSKKLDRRRLLLMKPLYREKSGEWRNQIISLGIRAGIQELALELALELVRCRFLYREEMGTSESKTTINQTRTQKRAMVTIRRQGSLQVDCQF
jgi:hypothetical protein